MAPRATGKQDNRKERSEDAVASLPRGRPNRAHCCGLTEITIFEGHLGKIHQDQRKAKAGLAGRMAIREEMVKLIEEATALRFQTSYPRVFQDIPENGIPENGILDSGTPENGTRPARAKLRTRVSWWRN